MPVGDTAGGVVGLAIDSEPPLGFVVDTGLPLKFAIGTESPLEFAIGTAAEAVGGMFGVAALSESAYDSAAV